MVRVWPVYGLCLIFYPFRFTATKKDGILRITNLVYRLKLLATLSADSFFLQFALQKMNRYIRKLISCIGSFTTTVDINRVRYKIIFIRKITLFIQVIYSYKHIKLHIISTISICLIFFRRWPFY